jgi:hypothetical protein
LLTEPKALYPIPIVKTGARVEDIAAAAAKTHRRNRQLYAKVLANRAVCASYIKTLRG